MTDTTRVRHATPPDAIRTEIATGHRSAGIRPLGRPTRRRTRKAERRRRRRARRTIFGRHPVLSVFAFIALAATPVWVSLGSALNDPGNGSSFGSRLAEWTRLHGGSGIVTWAENTWYSSHAPKVGGAPVKGAIPAAGRPAVVSKVATQIGLPTPAPIKPIASPPVPGEGIWHPAGRTVNGVPAIYEAFLRPDAVHTSLVAGVAWMDTKLLRAALYSGSTIPGGGPYTDTAPVTTAASTTLDAAFNSGFLMSDNKGGYYTQGKLIRALVPGDASFVIYKNGTASIADWGRDVTMNSSIVAVRQNDVLLVDGGHPVANLNGNDTSVWGYTVGNQVYVWRSGVGETANGALVYVAGPGLNITTLANLLVRAGAVRAMELDINQDWVNFATFAPKTVGGLATAANGIELLPNNPSDATRYFATWWTRDFFTMSVKTPGS